MVCDLVRGKNAALAADELRFTRKAAAPLVAKLLDSAIANASEAAKRQGEQLDLDTLYVKTIHADKAGDRNMRRWRPRAHGRATRIAKGMSHITIVLEEQDEG